MFEDHTDPKPGVLRVDITGNMSCVGKTTLAAIIADAIDKALPTVPIEVQSQEGDFHYRYDELLAGTSPRVQAEKIVIVDHNAPYVEPKREDTGRFYMLRDVAERIATG